jgi:hypothetical protein
MVGKTRDIERKVEDFRQTSQEFGIKIYENAAAKAEEEGKK